MNGGGKIIGKERRKERKGEGKSTGEREMRENSAGKMVSQN